MLPLLAAWAALSARRAAASASRRLMASSSSSSRSYASCAPASSCARKPSCKRHSCRGQDPTLSGALMLHS